MNTIPIFYACDDNFVKYTIVSLHSMMQNASKDHNYHVYILHTNISAEMQKKVLQLANARFRSKSKRRIFAVALRVV
jgi:lipopolysaccharide biosynthesis glycosyltransferase